jgi:hypothetical protein
VEVTDFYILYHFKKYVFGKSTRLVVRQFKIRVLVRSSLKGQDGFGVTYNFSLSKHHIQHHAAHRGCDRGTIASSICIDLHSPIISSIRWIQVGKDRVGRRQPGIRALAAMGAIKHNLLYCYHSDFKSCYLARHENRRKSSPVPQELLLGFVIVGRGHQTYAADASRSYTGINWAMVARGASL